MKERRRIRLVVTGDYLRKAAGLPDDAEIIIARHEPFRDSIEILLAHEKFTRVPEGTPPSDHVLGSWKDVT